MEHERSHPAGPPRSRRTAVSLLVLGAGVALAWLIGDRMQRREDALCRNAFESVAKDRVAAVERVFREALVGVDAVAALMQASPDVDRERFGSFARRLLVRYPGLQGLGYDPIVPHAERARHEATTRADGFAGYQILERGPSGDVVRAADRGVYVVAHFLEPLAGNEQALGFDIASEHVRRAALERAAASGRPAATGVLRLVQEPGGEAGILACAPVRRAGSGGDELAGFAVGVLRVGPMVEQSLAAFGRPDVELRVVDVGAEGGGLLYGPAALSAGSAARFVRDLSFAGREWRVECTPTAAFLAAQPGGGAAPTFWVLLLLTVLGAGYVYHLSGANQRLRQWVVEHRAAEESMLQLELAVENAMTGISRLDVDGRFVLAREGYARMLGYAPEEMIGLSWDVTVQPEDHERGVAAYRAMLETGRGEAVALARRKDGSSFHKHILLVRIDSDDGRHDGHYCFMRDVTEQTRAAAEKSELEAELRQSQKLEAVGTLASGIAHDFNNLLTAIEGHAARAREQLGSPDAAARSLELVRLACEQAAVVTRSLLTFSNRAEIERVPVDLAAVVRDSMQLMRSLLPASIAVEERLPAASVWVEGDRYQLQQVFMNLTINARDAMPDGGDLVVALRDDGGGRSRRAVLTVADSGSGMSAATAARVFEPFFTTKERGKGTGLGLSVVHGIVTDHGGRVAVESEQGRGARFHVELPVCVAPAAAAAAAADAPAAEFGPDRERGPGGRILVAEDNELVRPLIVAALERDGYDVVIAEDGALAIERFHEHRGELSLVVLDLDLPRKSGHECLREMREQRPDLPVVVVTGNGDGLPAAAARQRTLAKPFRMGELRAAVGELLGAARSG